MDVVFVDPTFFRLSSPSAYSSSTPRNLGERSDVKTKTANTVEPWSRSEVPSHLHSVGLGAWKLGPSVGSGSLILSCKTFDAS